MQLSFIPENESWTPPPRLSSISKSRRLLSPDELAFLARFVLHDVPRHSARGDRKGRRQIHLPRTASSGKIAVLRADHDLIRTRGHTRAGVDAGSATGFNHLCSRVLEDFEIAFTQAVIACFLGAELDVKLSRSGDALALPERVGEHRGIHVHIFILAGG